jgi:hypothetical protein
MAGHDGFDEAAFRRAMPFNLRPTRTPRVFSVPLPRAGFVPGSASAEELRAAGMRWRRSVANRHPVAAALWKRVASLPFTQGEEGAEAARWMPPMHRGTPAEGGGGSSTLDYNWAGPVLTGPGGWTAVIAEWVVPVLSQPSQPATTITYGGGESFTGWWLSSWVGLDGDLPINSTDLLQIGVAQQIDTHGNSFSWAWYEWWVNSAPASVVATFPFINAQTIPSSTFMVNPGDTVIAAVTYVTDESGATTGGHVSILNTSRATQNFVSLALPKPTGAQANGASAEWIVECPGGGEAGLFGQAAYSLAKFTPIDFTGAVACNCNASLSELVSGDPSAASLVNIETDTTPRKVLTATNPGTGTATITFIG